MKQNVSVNGHYLSCILAAVHWFPSTPFKILPKELQSWSALKTSLNVKVKQFLPVQRIHRMFIPAIDILCDEHVLVVCPLLCKLQC